MKYLSTALNNRRQQGDMRREIISSDSYYHDKIHEVKLTAILPNFTLQGSHEQFKIFITLWDSLSTC